VKRSVPSVLTILGVSPQHVSNWPCFQHAAHGRPRNVTEFFDDVPLDEISATQFHVLCTFNHLSEAVS
jgi:hypothetical protein